MRDKNVMIVHTHNMDNIYIYIYIKYREAIVTLNYFCSFFKNYFYSGIVHCFIR